MATAHTERPRAATDADLGLLTTKLARPRVPPAYVSRPRVDDMLDVGTRGPLTVVSAGAGWGKTLAAAHWAATDPQVGPVAWLSLDSSDNEPRQFWSYFVGVTARRLCAAAHEPAGRTRARLRQRGRVPVPVPDRRRRPARSRWSSSSTTSR